MGGGYDLNFPSVNGRKLGTPVRIQIPSDTEQRLRDHLAQSRESDFRGIQQLKSEGGVALRSRRWLSIGEGMGRVARDTSSAETVKVVNCDSRSPYSDETLREPTTDPPTTYRPAPVNNSAT